MNEREGVMVPPRGGVLEEHELILKEGSAVAGQVADARRTEELRRVANGGAVAGGGVPEGAGVDGLLELYAEFADAAGPREARGRRTAG